MNTFNVAFEAFMADTKALEKAIDDSTSAAYAGQSYKLELFEDGTCRVLSNNQIGNLYDSPGILISIPPLSESDRGAWLEEFEMEGPSFYDNAVEELRRNFENI